jgi:hypothetical protein
MADSDSVTPPTLRRPQRPRPRGRAGRSAAARFHKERIRNLKRQWKLWLGFLGLGVLSAVFMTKFGRAGLAVGGWMLGFITAISLFGWMIAFDVHALPWLWGSWGEEDSEKELTRLGGEWSVRHDIPNAYGNWDHVAIGPPGLHDRIKAAPRPNQGQERRPLVRSHPLQPRDFPWASAGLNEALAAEAGRCPWVQAVVTVWGDLPAVAQEKEGVVYVNGSGLVDWLESRPEAIDDEYRSSLVAALHRL